MRSRKARPWVIIYISGTEEERDRQFKWCFDLVQRRQYHLYGVARDGGDGSGLLDAQILKRSGIVEKIIVYSGDLLTPPDVESATGEIPAVPGGRDPLPARYRRIRRLRRGGAAEG